MKAEVAHLLRVDHSDLTDQRTNVDEQIEVHIDSRRSHDGVDNDTFAGLGVADEELVTLVLFCHKGGDVRLETASTQTHDNDSDDKACQRVVRVLNNARNRGDDQEDMTDDSDSNRDADGLKATPSCVCDVCAKQRDDIHTANETLVRQRGGNFR